MPADAWGCPVMPLPNGPYSSFPQVSIYTKACTKLPQTMHLSNLVG